jgi:hypothetical protein
VFVSAERECRFLPSPSELLAFAKLASDVSDADAAWIWVQEFLEMHGVEGRTKTGAMRVEHGKVIQSQDTPAPDIPRPIAQTLILLGGSVRRGLERVQATGIENYGFLRREFIAAYEKTRN